MFSSTLNFQTLCLICLLLICFCPDESLPSTTTALSSSTLERHRRLNANILPRVEIQQGTKDGIECAYLFESETFYGNYTALSNYEIRHFGESAMQMQSVLLKANCSVTLFGRRERRKVFREDAFSLGRWNTKRARSGCCECGGCQGMERRVESERPLPYCAKLFQEGKCTICRGFRIWIGVGEERSEMSEEENNKVSSLFVRDRCELNVFKENNFGGTNQTFRGIHDYLPLEWLNQISSYKCYCRR